MSINSSILVFVDFVNQSLPLLEKHFHDQNERIVDDWLQANWEIVVESSLNVFLEPYGNGADCNGASSRVWKPEKLPTHRLMCISLSTRKKIKFDRFSRIENGELINNLPWNCAISDEYNYVILGECDFDIEKIDYGLNETIQEVGS